MDKKEDIKEDKKEDKKEDEKETIDLPQRDRTDFVQDLRKAYAAVKYENNSLKDFQKVILKYLRYVKIKQGGRGLLIAADPGMGKTRIAIAVAEEFMRAKIHGINKIYMISQKSLHDNFSENIEKYKKNTGRSIDPHYVSLNASNFGEKVRALNFENSVVIIDEAHKFASMVVNGSEAGVSFYKTLRDTRDVLVLFLTGTPIMNRPFEVVVYFNIIAGYALLPENAVEFDKFFGAGRNIGLYQNRIMGLSSFVHIDANSEDFPTVPPLEEIHVEMSADEYTAYKVEQEKEERENAAKFVRRSGRAGVHKAFEGLEHSSSTYRVRTRQLCNCDSKIEWVVKYAVDNPDKLGSVYSQFIGEGGIAKVKAALDKTGLYEEYNGQPIEAVKKGGKKYYISMTSEHSSEERTDLQKVFNTPANAEHRMIQLVFCSAASTFGLHFNNVEFAIVLEPHWLYETLYQYFQRFNRRHSHSGLPLERRVVRRFIMLTDLPVPEDAGIISTDVDIYEKSKANKAENELYYKATEATSIEKLLGLENEGATAEPKAYICAPTGDILFTRDFYTDMQRPNMCRLNYQEKVKARQIIVDGKEYYYTDIDNIFVFDEKVGGYVELNHKKEEYKTVNKLLKARAV